MTDLDQLLGMLRRTYIEFDTETEKRTLVHVKDQTFVFGVHGHLEEVRSGA